MSQISLPNNYFCFLTIDLASCVTLGLIFYVVTRYAVDSTGVTHLLRDHLACRSDYQNGDSGDVKALHPLQHKER